MLKKTKKKVKKISRVNGALFRHLIGRKINDLIVIRPKKCKSNFYFFTNSQKAYDPNLILGKLIKYANNRNTSDYCFGVFKMKNNKEYYFLCRIDTLYINEHITHIHIKPNVEYSKLKN